jgi:7-cyano-7-deazaguanine synthase
MKAVLILSGGVDSTTLLYKMLADGYEVEALTFNYAQRHKKEIDCAKEIARLTKVPHRVIDLGCLAAILGDSALLGGKEVPKCHYTEDAARLMKFLRSFMRLTGTTPRSIPTAAKSS